jgi:hypothetical protein
MVGKLSIKGGLSGFGYSSSPYQSGQLDFTSSNDPEAGQRQSRKPRSLHGFFSHDNRHSTRLLMSKLLEALRLNPSIFYNA